MSGINRMLKVVPTSDRDKLHLSDILNYCLYWVKNSSFDIWGASLVLSTPDVVTSPPSMNEPCFPSDRHQHSPHKLTLG